MNDNTTPPPDHDPTDPESPLPSTDPSNGGDQPPVDAGAAAGPAWGGPQWGPGSPGAPGWGPPWSAPAGGFGPAYGWSNDPWAGYPPYGSPTAYPPAPGSQSGYAPLAPAKPSRMAPVVIAVAIVIALVSGVTGAGIGLALKQSSTTTPGGSSSTNSSAPGNSSSSSTVVHRHEQPQRRRPRGCHRPLGGGRREHAGGRYRPRRGDGVHHQLLGRHPDQQPCHRRRPVRHRPDRWRRTTTPATVLGYDPVDDVALIKINDISGLNLKVAPLGNSDNLTIGADVVAIGNAYGKGGTPAVVSGTVADLDQSITASDGGSSENLTGMIQMNADIVSGDSGGPLVNAAGKVIGMDTAGTETGASFEWAVDHHPGIRDPDQHRPAGGAADREREVQREHQCRVRPLHRGRGRGQRCRLRRPRLTGGTQHPGGERGPGGGRRDRLRSTTPRSPPAATSAPPWRPSTPERASSSAWWTSWASSTPARSPWPAGRLADSDRVRQGSARMRLLPALDSPRERPRMRMGQVSVTAQRVAARR